MDGGGEMGHKAPSPCHLISYDCLAGETYAWYGSPDFLGCISYGAHCDGRVLRMIILYVLR